MGSAGAVAGSASVGLCAVPADGVACALVTAGWVCAWACAAAGVIPAKARAIAHPISFIFTPVTCIRTESATAPPEFRGLIGAGSRSLKRLAQENMNLLKEGGSRPICTPLERPWRTD